MLLQVSVMSRLAIINTIKMLVTQIAKSWQDAVIFNQNFQHFLSFLPNFENL